MHCSEHWSHSSPGCYCHLWTCMFGITFLTCFTTKFCFGTLLASISSDLSQYDIRGSIFQRVDNIPWGMCGKWLTSCAENGNHKWQSEMNTHIFCLVTFSFIWKARTLVKSLQYCWSFCSSFKSFTGYMVAPQIILLWRRLTYSYNSDQWSCC